MLSWKKAIRGEEKACRSVRGKENGLSWWIIFEQQAGGRRCGSCDLREEGGDSAGGRPSPPASTTSDLEGMPTPPVMRCWRFPEPVLPDKAKPF